jgi:hypothetical protein
MTKQTSNQGCRAIENDHMLFNGWVENGVVSPGLFEEANTQEELLDRLLRLLDNCRHKSPDATCDGLGIARGSTYSRAVRHVAKHPKLRSRDDLSIPHLPAPAHNEQVRDQTRRAEG